MNSTIFLLPAFASIFPGQKHMCELLVVADGELVLVGDFE